MAIITKIREKSGLAVAIVALGLILFIVGGDVLSGNSRIINIFKDNGVGTIAGHKVSYEEFQNESLRAEQDFAAQQERGPNEQERQSIREQAWMQLIFKNAYKDQYEQLGIEVSPEEQIDMVQGENIHPAVRQAFSDPKTNEFDKKILINFLSNFDKVPPKQQYAWQSFEAKLPDDRLRSKYEALLKNSVYVTTEEAKREYEVQTERLDMNYVYAPYTLIADSTIKISDNQLLEYLRNNKEKYKSQPSLSLAYVKFVVKPSSEDSLYFSKELASISQDFEQATDDTLFASSKSDVPVKVQKTSIGQLPAELAQAGGLQVGKVYGPFISGGSYTLYKIKNVSRQGPEFAKASHILFKPATEDEAGRNAAKAQAEKILTEIKGGADFAEKARVYGTDGTAAQGGDLGWFDRTRMVKPFADAVFAAKNIGLLPQVVKTDFGYHLIKITAPISRTEYELVSIQKNISPGQKTQEAAYARANQFRSGVNNRAEFEATIKKSPDLVRMSAQNIPPASSTVNELSDARELVRWGYNQADTGQVSDIQEYTDSYVVAVLTKKTQQGYAQLEDVRELILPEVRKRQKSDKILAALKGSTLEEMAKSYTGAKTGSGTAVTLASPSVADLGYDPISVGTAFGIKPNTVSRPFAGESGVVALLVTAKTPTPIIADYSSYKTTILQRNAGRVSYSLAEAIKELADVTDKRYKFF